MQKEHQIYDSTIDIDEYEKYFSEVFPELDQPKTEIEKWKLAYEMKQMELDDEKVNLNIPGTFVGFYDIGLWNGRAKGAKIFTNLNQIFSVNGMRNADSEDRFYVKGTKLKATFCHHDGINYAEYYLIKEDLPGAEKFITQLKQLRKEPTPSQIKKYCRSAGNIVKKIYGW